MTAHAATPHYSECSDCTAQVKELDALRAENQRLLAKARTEARTPKQQLVIEALGMKAEIERLRARVAELEAAYAAAVLNLTGSRTEGSPPTLTSDKRA